MKLSTLTRLDRRRHYLTLSLPSITPLLSERPLLALISRKSRERELIIVNSRL